MNIHERYRVKPKQKIDLGKWDPADAAAFDGDKKAG